ncbi:MAG: hypothetical protein AAB453_02510 [Patescibacteria group bacterium]
MASLEEIRAERLKKLKKLYTEDLNPYPIESNYSHTLAEALKDF